MKTITVDKISAIKDLRLLTKKGLTECVNAFKEADGDFDKAVEILGHKKWDAGLGIPEVTWDGKTSETLEQQLDRIIQCKYPHACCCMGPQNGQPFCPCSMNHAIIYNGLIIFIGKITNLKGQEVDGA